MKGHFLYLLLIVAIILGSGFYIFEQSEKIQEQVSYIFELQQEKGRIEGRVQEITETARKAEEIKEKNIIQLQAELDSLTIKLENLEKEMDVLQKEKIELGARVEGVEILDAKIKKLQQDKVLLETTIRQHPGRLEQKLRDPTWAELKTFLRTDRTNEIIFDPKRFDCSGFAITLFRNARAAGFRTAYVEVVFDLKGHALNKFRTTDRGYVFIDVTGDKHGTGRDTVAYIRKGELFGVIYIGAVVETKIDCRRIGPCRDFINPLPIKRHTELFAYPFFQEKVVCGGLYDRCLRELNTEIDRFNRGVSDLNREQLIRWQDNNTKLLNQLTIGRRWVFTETENRVTNIEVYW